MESVDQETQAARDKLKEKYGEKGTQIGSKGTIRRKKKSSHKTQITDDKKLKSIIKKYGLQQLNGIDEVNMFKDDNTIIHFSKPEVMSSIQSSAFVVMGKAETKTVQDLIPDIIHQLGPKQMKILKDLITKKLPTQEGADKIPEQEGEDEDDVPKLVGDANFEEASKQVD